MNGARLGDRARLYRRPQGIAADALFRMLRRTPSVVDVVVTEEHVAVTFDAPPSADAQRALTSGIEAALLRAESERRGGDGASSEVRPLHTVKVTYDGPDLDECAERLGLPCNELIARHSSGLYEVKFSGFLPGFAYLGDLDATLILPRRSTPRPRIPPLSVAIADAYTAVYPFASPGGWNLIGTAIDFESFRFELGDRVRFEPAR